MYNVTILFLNGIEKKFEGIKEIQVGKGFIYSSGSELPISDMFRDDSKNVCLLGSSTEVIIPINTICFLSVEKF